MSRAARLGPFFALAWLVLLWPVVGVYAHGEATGSRLAGLTGLLAVYAGVYGWYCFHGHRLESPLVPAAVAGALTLLGAGVNHVSGVMTANPYVVPLMVVGYGLRPRVALPAIVALSVVALVDTLSFLGLSSGDVIGLGAVLFPQLLLWGLAAMGLRYLLGVLAELRAAREQVSRLAAA